MKTPQDSFVFSEKSRARAWAREQAPAADEAAALSPQLTARLLAQDWMFLPTPLGLYHALPGEPDTAPVFAAAAAGGWELALPAALADGTYAWRALAPDAQLVPGPHAIRQPPPEADPADPASLRVILVPGLAFDRHGTRLGHGGGIYDRLLAPAADAALLVGLCFSAQLADTLPAAPHDIPMDLVVTDRSILAFPSAADKLARLLR